MKKLGLSALLSLSLCALSSTSFAHKEDPKQPLIFFGLGGSFNSVKVDQSLAGEAFSEVFDAGTLVAFGAAGGPAVDFHLTENTLAPVVQLGYTQPAGGNCFWGVKFFYEYLGLTLTHQPIDLPQQGAFETTDATRDTFTGNAIINSSQTSVNHELALLLFMGQTINKINHVYLGVGPVWYSTKTNINNGVGYADINGSHSSISGSPISTSNTKWTWGGAAQIGWSRHLSRSWVADLTYTFAISSRFSSNNNVPYASSQIADGVTLNNSGIIALQDSQRITTQAVMLTMNKLFFL